VGTYIDVPSGCNFTGINPAGTSATYSCPSTVTNPSCTADPSQSVPNNICADSASAVVTVNGGPSCVSYQGQSCTSAANSCGQTNSGSYNCDGSCSASTPPNSSCPAITVTADCPPGIVWTGQTLDCLASVGETSNQAVTWSMVSGGGSINPSTGVYTAPSAPTTAVVKATSNQDPSVSNDAPPITVQALSPITLTVTPSNANIPVETPVTVTATGGTGTFVNWSAPGMANAAESGVGNDTLTGLYPQSSTYTVVVTDSLGDTGDATIVINGPNIREVAPP
jgi:hypothetical protein